MKLTPKHPLVTFYRKSLNNVGMWIYAFTPETFRINYLVLKRGNDNGHAISPKLDIQKNQNKRNEYFWTNLNINTLLLH